MRDADGFKYFLSDHLGSVSVVLSDKDENGDVEVLEQQRYLPFGGPRELPNYSTIQLTDYTYTGQRDLPGTGLMDYDARFYSPTLGKFIQPDTIIPDLANSQSWNRYAYVANNPIMRNDPTGHFAIPAISLALVVLGVAAIAVGITVLVYHDQIQEGIEDGVDAIVDMMSSGKDTAMGSNPRKPMKAPGFFASPPPPNPFDPNKNKKDNSGLHPAAKATEAIVNWADGCVKTVLAYAISIAAAAYYAIGVYKRSPIENALTPTPADSATQTATAAPSPTLALPLTPTGTSTRTSTSTSTSTATYTPTSTSTSTATYTSTSTPTPTPYQTLWRSNRWNE